jgi:hypothetical protein
MVGAFLVLDVFGLALVSRFSARLGLVTLRQRFVRRCQGVIFLLESAGNANGRNLSSRMAGWFGESSNSDWHQRPIFLR